MIDWPVLHVVCRLDGLPLFGGLPAIVSALVVPDVLARLAMVLVVVAVMATPGGAVPPISLSPGDLGIGVPAEPGAGAILPLPLGGAALPEVGDAAELRKGTLSAGGGGVRLVVLAGDGRAAGCHGPTGHSRDGGDLHGE